MPVSRCRSCKAPIMWVETEATAKKPARMMPIDAEETGEPAAFSDGNLVFTGMTSVKGNRLIRYVPAGKGNRRSHFSSCPNAKTHRKP